MDAASKEEELMRFDAVVRFLASEKWQTERKGWLKAHAKVFARDYSASPKAVTLPRAAIDDYSAQTEEASAQYTHAQHETWKDYCEYVHDTLDELLVDEHDGDLDVLVDFIEVNRIALAEAIPLVDMTEAAIEGGDGEGGDGDYFKRQPLGFGFSLADAKCPRANSRINHFLGALQFCTNFEDFASECRGMLQVRKTSGIRDFKRHSSLISRRMSESVSIQKRDSSRQSSRIARMSQRVKGGLAKLGEAVTGHSNRAVAGANERRSSGGGSEILARGGDTLAMMRQGAMLAELQALHDSSVSGGIEDSSEVRVERKRRIGGKKLARLSLEQEAAAAVVAVAVAAEAVAASEASEM